jgi:hypothetical protein
MIILPDDNSGTGESEKVDYQPFDQHKVWRAGGEEQKKTSS